MIMRTPFAKAVAAALASVLALSTAAQAQPSGSYSSREADRYGYGYDPCRRDANQRGTAGALIGAGMGAVIGSNAAARNARTEGALLGGLLGAITGGIVGNKTAACTGTTRTSTAPPPPSSPTDYRDSDRRYEEGDVYAHRDDYPLPPPRRSDDVTRDRVEGATLDPNGCTLAESPIHMPDGRTETRFVRVCRDASGRYAVVD